MLEKVSLFRNKRDFFHFFLLLFVLFSLSISLEFHNYKELTKFDSQLVNATVLKQYQKSRLTKKGKLKTYQVLKLKSDSGFTFYTTTSIKTPDIKYKKIELEAWAGKISFYEYLTGFYSFSKILSIENEPSQKERLNAFINKQHSDKNISLLYQALYTAKQLPYELQVLFSNHGVSHLIAISGFHLGVLSGVLFFLIKYPYKFLQNRYFPYRSYKRDTLFIISSVLLAYLLFLDSPPSLLRAFVMLIIGSYMYDRGVKIISMQTLLLTIVLILAIYPKLFFSIGFWLSVSGVFYIFLFLIHFNYLSKFKQFFFVPLWVYLLMLPYSLVLFGNFSIYHPLSIIWTSIFSLFYPLSILLHVMNIGELFDPLLALFINIDTQATQAPLPKSILFIEVILSLLSLYSKKSLYLLLVYCFFIFIYLLYNSLYYPI